MLTSEHRLKRSHRLRTQATTVAEPTSIASFETDLNWMAIAWQEDTLLGNMFGYPSRRLAEHALGRVPGMSQSFCRVTAEGQVDDVPRWVSNLIAKLKLYAGGEKVEFGDVPLSLDHLTTFGAKVIARCREIPWGQTSSYGELAGAAGSPGAARAVGSVMAKNRYPLIVPCHRVLSAGGAIGGYSARDGVTMKRRLLAMEDASVGG